MKRMIGAIVAVFVVWGVLDFIIHGVLLGGMYAATPMLWRPMEDMNMGLLYLVTLIAAACFVYVYVAMVGDRSMGGALTYGLVFGIGAGVSFGIGSYVVMPISGGMAAGWFLGTVVEALVGAWVAWLIAKRGAAA